MSKIRLIEQCIENAERRISKLTPEALMVPALSSLNIRHLMNNLGSISTNYLEHGVHKGGLFCSTIYKNDNLRYVCAGDSWASDANSEDKAREQFIDNAYDFKPSEPIFEILEGDTFDWSSKDIMYPIDLYLFDADHGEDSQCRALTHFLTVMADEFIFCVDDYDWADVKNGTERGIKETGVEVLFEKIWKGNDHDNETWWNGYAIFLLKKKP